MSQGERYAEFPPPPSLAPWVRVVWTYACPEPSRTIQRIAPDGCPELILDVGSPYEEEGQGGVWRLQPPALFAGQMTRPIAIRPIGPIELVAVRFHPDGARDWLGRAVNTATNLRVDMVDRLKGVVPPAGDPEAQARAMTDRLEASRVQQGWSLDPLVRAEVEAMMADEPAPDRSPSEMRALQRRFLDRVGISPRMLRSVMRFRRVFDHALEPSDAAVGWLEAGLGAGYFDQPQMARDFRRFLGCTATEWAREQVELARAIASQTYKPAPPHRA